MFYLKLILVLVAGLHDVSCWFSTDVRRTFLPNDVNETTYRVDIKWIEQPLDHFNNNDIRVFKMKYYQILNDWAPGGPVYLFIQHIITPTNLFAENGLLRELTGETNGALFLAEHRYYGESQPFSETNTDNLKFLSSKQALADLANLVKHIKSLPQFQTSRVVVIGSFYGGSLAAWMRKLYPGVVDAAVASSAPLLAKANFYEFFETVGDDYKKHGSEECFNDIKKTFKHYKKMFTSVKRTNALKIEENICDDTDMNIERNQQLFTIMKSEHLIPATLNSLTSISNTCFNVSKLLHKCKFNMKNYEKLCCDYRLSNFVELIEQDKDAMSWTYQQCTEFGFFETTENNIPFTNSIPVGFYYAICRNLFGPEINGEKLKHKMVLTNDLYGGLNPKVTNVVFVNGGLDPWHKLSVLKDLSPNAPAIFLPFEGQSREFDYVTKYTSGEMMRARLNIKEYVKKWINH